MLRDGMELILEKEVESKDTAAVVASGALEVFSTPMMIAFMENTAFELAQRELEAGMTTVGTSVNIKHMRANLVGDRLECRAVLVKADGRKLNYTVEVTYNGEVVGSGEHARYIVDEKKFLEGIKR